jgi:hypothetical protein
MNDSNNPIIIKGEPLPSLKTRTITGSQLSESGHHLSESGSGIRQLAASPEAVHAVTEEMVRPTFGKP